MEQDRETPWHVRDVAEVVSEFDVEPERGLAAGAVRERLERYGPNRIESGQAVPWWRLALRQVTDPLIYILLLAAIVSMLFQEYVDAAVILAVVVINGIIGFIQEFRARRAIESLAKMTAPDARVLRDGHEQQIPSEDVIPGDILVLAAGDRVPADARLLAVHDLEADEAALTGESQPVSKQKEAIDEEKAVPGDQFSMVFSGTSITRGRGRAVVVRTGDASELGHIARTTRGMAEVQVPIQKKMNRLARGIGAAVLALTVILLAGGLLAGVELQEVARTAVALAVSAVPEGLPIVLTVVLATGVQRMAKRNAIIRSLSAVETLGSTTVVGTDKTGTLTANEMTVRVIWTAGQRFDVSGSGYDPTGGIRPAGDSGESQVGEAVRVTLLAGLLANEAGGLPQRADDGAPESDAAGGDPTELALLVSAAKAGLDPEQTRAEYAQLDIIPFESDLQFMATLNETPDGRSCIFVKGAPEAVLQRCSRQLTLDGDEEELDTAAAEQTADTLADEGYRVLGMAFGYQDIERFDGDQVGTDLVFAGLQAMEDPVRPEAIESVKLARQAGIRVIMLTGDHVRTARAIGEQLGLIDDDGRAEEGQRIEDLSEEQLDRAVREVNVFARVSPDHKLQLVERLKDQGHIVAVTGDGVNDAPALQAAHLGVAMGRSGTDVAREASDMVLTDDNFASITHAVEEGRVVFLNIRKVTYFLLSTGVAEVLAVVATFAAPSPVVFVPTQILWINLVTNGIQDVALAFEKGEPGLLEQPPRKPEEGVLSRDILWRLGWIGLLIAAGTLSVFWWMLQRGESLELARSAAMTQLVVFQFFHALNSRSFDRSILRVPLRDNPYLAIGLVAALIAHLGALHLPFMQTIFETEPLSLEHWSMMIGIGFLIIMFAEADKALLRRPRQERLRRERKGQGEP